jgi:hypothetical protein
MANGYPHEDPMTEIVDLGNEVFGWEIDSLVRRLHGVFDKEGRRQLQELLWDYYEFGVDGGTNRPHALLDKLRTLASPAPYSLEPPIPRRRFQYWGYEPAIVVLPSGVPTVRLDLLSELPHGDPLYRLTVGRYTVGGWKSPTGFFGRDLHLSECAGHLGITSYRYGSGCRFHTIDLAGQRIWTHDGFVRIESVSPDRICFRPYISGDGANPSLGEWTECDLDAEGWSHIVPGL